MSQRRKPYKRVELTRGFYALVDAEDFERVSKHSWCILDLRKSRKNLIYAQSRIKNRINYLHRFVLGLKAAKERIFVDHKDGDGLNCRKYNLHQRTDAQNKRNRRGLSAHNTSGETNIHRDKRRGLWKAEIQVDSNKVNIGRFPTIKAAKQAVIEAKAAHGY